MQTPHFATFDTLHRPPEAKEIADRLGLRSIKRSDVCTQCHYTEQNQDGRVRVVAGVSCESCHGGAADWLALHADYGGDGCHEGGGVGRASAKRLEGEHRPGHEQSAQHLSHRAAMLRLPHGAERIGW